MSLSLRSSSFASGSSIPARYTCQGAEISPALAWSGTPEKTQSFALIVEDLDTKNKMFTHWLIYNIPSTKQNLDENIPKQSALDDGSLQGLNEHGEVGYMGPCPPENSSHRYRFTLYALDNTLEGRSGMNKRELREAIKDHIIDQGELMGNYQK